MTIYTLDDRVAMRETIKQLRSTISLVEAVASGQQKAASATHKFLLDFTGQSELSGQHAALSHFLKSSETEHLDRLIAAAPNDMSAFSEALNPEQPPARHHLLLIDFLHGMENGTHRYGMVSMPPGHAKPLDVETPVLMADGSYKRLGDIVVGDEVITMLGRPRKVLAVHEQGVLPVTEIQTQSGRIVRAHADHLFHTPAGWIEAGKLVVNDQLALVCSYDIPNTSLVSMDGFILAGYLLSLAFARGGETSKLEKIGREFRHSDPLILDDFIRTARRMGFTTAKIRKRRYGKDVTSIALCQKGQAWIKANGLDGLTKRDGRPPEWVFQGDKARIGAFLGALFSCDLQFRPRFNKHTHQNRQVMIRIRNGCMLEDVQRLLQRLGVRTRRTAVEWSNYNYSAALFHKLYVDSAEDQRGIQSHLRFIGEQAKAWAEPIRGGGFDSINRLFAEDRIFSIKVEGECQMRCLTVEEDESFLANDIVVHNSTYSSHLFPAWYLGKHPDHRYLQAGHTIPFARQKLSRPVQKNLLNPVYRRIFPDVGLHPIDNGLGNWRLSNGLGEYTAAGVGKGISGERAHGLGLDDPFPLKENAENDGYREKVWQWYVNDFRTRRLPTAFLMIVVTRWHPDDPSGRIEAMLRDGQIDEEWAIINLPALCEDPKNDPLGRSMNEPLWPDFFNLKYLLEQKSVMTPSEWSCLYQGNPVPEKGNLVQRDWLRTYTTLPPKEEWRRIFLSADTAETETQRSDYTVIGTFLETISGNVYLLNIIRQRMGQPEFETTVEEEGRRMGAVDLVVEDKGIGHHYAANVAKRLPHEPRPPFAITAVGTKNMSKKMRMDGVTPMMRAGRLYLPERAPWLATFLAEILKFPAVKNDDQADVLSQALAFVREGSIGFLGSKRLGGTR